MGLEKLKKVKMFAEKLATKTAGFVKKGSKIIKKIKPVVDVVTDFIPYGDTIDKAIDIGVKVADKFGNVLEDAGRGKNVMKSIKNNVSRNDIENVKKPIQNQINKLPPMQRERINKAVDVGKRIVEKSIEVAREASQPTIRRSQTVDFNKMKEPSRAPSRNHLNQSMKRASTRPSSPKQTKEILKKISTRPSSPIRFNESNQFNQNTKPFEEEMKGMEEFDDTMKPKKSPVNSFSDLDEYGEIDMKKSMAPSFLTNKPIKPEPVRKEGEPGFMSNVLN